MGTFSTRSKKVRDLVVSRLVSAGDLADLEARFVDQRFGDHPKKSCRVCVFHCLDLPIYVCIINH